MKEATKGKKDDAPAPPSLTEQLAAAKSDATRINQAVESIGA